MNTSKQAGPPPQADWIGPAVAVVICLLTPLVNPRISLSVAVIAMLGLSIYYHRRLQSPVGAMITLAGALVIAAALVLIMTRN